jgi:hypothetical protein
MLLSQNDLLLTTHAGVRREFAGKSARMNVGAWICAGGGGIADSRLFTS